MLIYLIVFLVLQIVLGAFLWKGFTLAGQPAWKAFVPVLNTLVFLKIIGRPWWLIFLAYLPVIGNVMAIVFIYEWLHVFGYRKKRYTLFALLTLGIFAAYVTYLPKTNYQPRNEEQIRENVPSWLNAVIFSVVVASFIHTYFIQPFNIPTSSMEKTLLVGDFLFVSKFHYGARLPLTPLSTPMVHDTLPVLGVKSYLSKPQMPYLRLPGLQKVKRNDIVVFSWPTDTVRFFRDKSHIHVQKPIDKKSNYVKRAVAIAGDTLEIRDGVVFINGKKSEFPRTAKLESSYTVTVAPEFWTYITNLYNQGGKQYSLEQIFPAFLYQNYNITDGFGVLSQTSFVIQSATPEVAEKLRSTTHVQSVEERLAPKGEFHKEIFPHSPNFAWNEDNFGPLAIPAKGQSVHLTLENLPLYQRLISEYEGNLLKVEGNTIFINGQPTENYTFTQDYYWMMGDNRHNSEDSRYWGFVPFDHIMGKPVMIWLSLDQNQPLFSAKKVRWERLFSSVNDPEQNRSYLWYVLIIGALCYFGYEFYQKKSQK